MLLASHYTKPPPGSVTSVLGDTRTAVQGINDTKPPHRVKNTRELRHTRAVMRTRLLGTVIFLRGTRTTVRPIWYTEPPPRVRNIRGVYTQTAIHGSQETKPPLRGKKSRAGSQVARKQNRNMRETDRTPPTATMRKKRYRRGNKAK